MTSSHSKPAARLSDLAQFKALFDKTGTHIRVFIFPALLSLVAALFEGVSIGLLVPLVKGVLEADFGFAAKVPVLKLVFFHLGLNMRSNAQLFITLIVIIFVAAVLKNLLQYLSLVLFDRGITSFANRLRQIIFARYLAFGKKFFDENNVGHLTNVVLGFTRQISVALKAVGFEITAILMLIVYFTIMVVISWQLTIFALLLFPILNFATTWLIRKVRKHSKTIAKFQTKLGFLISNVIVGIPLVKSCSSETEEEKRFNSLSSKNAGAEYSLAKKQRLVPVIQELVTLTAFLLLISLMAFLYVRQGGELSAFLVFFIVLRRTLSALGSFNRVRVVTAEVGGVVSKILELFDDQGKPFIADGHADFPGLQREIKFNHLYFAYDAAREVLRDISLTVEKGKTTALVGKTGSGKTTLIHLLLRFYECLPGMIYIDGEDIRNITLNSLHSHIALVSQDPVLFNDTLRANMTYGLFRKVSAEELIEVSKKARLHDLIQSLPAGLETLIGDRGIQLSGGERQRVAIARAILKGAEILILDEATSALDSKTEKLIQEAIDEAISGKTAIVIAHRLSTIRRADKIVVIENGQIMEEGDLANLLNNKNRFSEYWDEQKFG